MIEKHQVMLLLIESCKSYKSTWDKYMSENYHEGDEQLLYMDLSNFAKYIIKIYKSGENDCLYDVFNTIEIINNDGDEYVQEAITIGLLEDIQNFALGEKIELNEFEKYLGRESSKWWKQIDKFWTGKIKYVGETLKDE